MGHGYHKLDASFSETDIPYIEVHVAQPAAAVP